MLSDVVIKWWRVSALRYSCCQCDTASLEVPHCMMRTVRVCIFMSCMDIHYIGDVPCD